MRRLSTLAAGALLVLFWWMAAGVSDEHSTTADEIFHLTAGHAYWRYGDYRLHPENGNFPQRWAALPGWLAGDKFPPANQPAWRNADAAEIGFQFFYEQGNDLARMLRRARAMNALLGVALGALVFAWSKSLFGAPGALASAAVFTFCPSLLAHAGLATSDIAACLGFLAATLALWRLLHRMTAGRIVAAGAALGLLALAKFSAVLIAPAIVLLAALRWARGTTLPVRLGRWRARLRGGPALAAMVGGVAGALVLAGALVWAAFGFRFQGARGGDLRYNQPWTVFYGDPAKPPGFTLRATQMALNLRLLPEPYLYGLAHTLHFARGRPAFFNGEYRTTGWAVFFPTVFLAKTTPALFGLSALAAFGLAGLRPNRRGRLAYRLAPLAIVLVVYWTFAVTSRLNIGHRHILVTYPVLAIFAGAAAFSFRRAWGVGLAAALVAWQGWDSLNIRPNYLAYFNPLFGGPARAYERFVDSSLDWGQDLPGLARWLAANPGGKPYLSYFGSGHPPYYGIQATRVADGFFDLRPREVAPALEGGVYAISATMFQQVYTFVRHGWTPEHERRYRELEQWRAAAAPAPAGSETASRLIELEHLRFGRLCAGLHGRKPDAQIGFSILIFRLTSEEVLHLLEGPAPYAP